MAFEKIFRVYDHKCVDGLLDIRGQLLAAAFCQTVDLQNQESVMKPAPCLSNVSNNELLSGAKSILYASFP